MISLTVVVLHIYVIIYRNVGLSFLFVAEEGFEINVDGGYILKQSLIYCLKRRSYNGRLMSHNLMFYARHSWLLMKIYGRRKIAMKVGHSRRRKVI
jgi:hypothetical protein